MRAHLAAALVVACALLAFFAHAALTDVKPIEILHLDAVKFAPATIEFQVRIHPVDSDREEWVLLCDVGDDEPCTQQHNERNSSRSIEGRAADPLWVPKPWRQVPGGEYAVVATIGPKGRIRAADVRRILLKQPD